MGFGEFESKRKMLGYSFFYILLQYIIEGSLNRNFRQYGQLKSRVE